MWGERLRRRFNPFPLALPVLISPCFENICIRHFSPEVLRENRLEFAPVLL